MKIEKTVFRSVILLLALLLTGASQALANTVTGIVTDDSGEPLIGVTVMVVGTSDGTVTDIDGNYRIDVKDIKKSELRFTYVGMSPLVVKIGGRTTVNVVMKNDESVLEELVVVGYGQQKKASVVGAIAQTSGETLMHSGGVTSVGGALTGNVPGVITMAKSGQPGDEDPDIVIRSKTTWNSGSGVLVLVDGVERPMNSVDLNSIETLSVLKDASATAVYGVKGANGVILITTKRGKEGRAEIGVNFNATMKVVSDVPSVAGSPEALYMRNQIIERELGLTPESWLDITSASTIEKYRNPSSLEESERYPNVDWQDMMFKKSAFSYNPNFNVRGGTKFVKYYAAFDFLHEGDIFKCYDTGRGYTSGYGFDRINVRSNLDFQITKSTVFKINLSGSHGQKQSPRSASGGFFESRMRAAAYSAPPDAFMPIYSDGTFGYYGPDDQSVNNSILSISNSGIQKRTETRITTDFTLNQDLSFITKGLSANATVSWDNIMVEDGRGINENYYTPQKKWINPATGEVQYREQISSSGFDFSEDRRWSVDGGSIDVTYVASNIQRHLFYQAQLNYARQFGKHDVSAMGVFNRTEHSYGNEFTRYREDWAFRATYNFDGRYFIEYNGAYNGSEKFSDKYRFDFFNSGAVGWRLSEEKFMNWSRNWLDNFKIRYSIGEVGDDAAGNRWAYATQWVTTNPVTFSNTNTSPYGGYKVSVEGNPDLHWEKALKQNLGVDFTLLNGLVSGTVELFSENRHDIIVNGPDRAIPSYFGGNPPAANLGKVKSNGYELELRVNKMFDNGMRVWGNFNMTHSKNKILDKDEPALMEDYQKAEGFQIGQDHIYYDAGYTQSWDDVIGMTTFDSNDNLKLPGVLVISDYNGDGVINSFDKAPYGYTTTPNNTYNATLGWEWKGWSVMVQFYGVNNVQRTVAYTEPFNNRLDTYYKDFSWWNVGVTDADRPMPYWNSKPNYNGGYDVRFNHYDGSYIRLKNLEIAYTWTEGWIKKIGLRDLRIYLSGNNLWQYHHMPDDFESNWDVSNPGYPTMRRFNLGIRFNI